MKQLSEVVGRYQLDHMPETLPSLWPQIEQELHKVRKAGVNTAILESLFEEQERRENTSRANAGTERRKTNAYAVALEATEERERKLIEQVESLVLDNQHLEFQLQLTKDKIRDEIQGAFEEGQAVALTGACIKLAGVLELDAETLEMSLVSGMDGNIVAALDFMNTLLEAMERNVA